MLKVQSIISIHITYLLTQLIIFAQMHIKLKSDPDDSFASPLLQSNACISKWECYEV